MSRSIPYAPFPAAKSTPLCLGETAKVQEGSRWDGLAWKTFANLQNDNEFLEPLIALTSEDCAVCLVATRRTREEPRLLWERRREAIAE